MKSKESIVKGAMAICLFILIVTNLFAQHQEYYPDPRYLDSKSVGGMEGFKIRFAYALRPI